MSVLLFAVGLFYGTVGELGMPHHFNIMFSDTKCCASLEIQKENLLCVFFTYFACFVAEKLAAIVRTCNQPRTLPQIKA